MDYCVIFQDPLRLSFKRSSLVTPLHPRVTGQYNFKVRVCLDSHEYSHQEAARHFGSSKSIEPEKSIPFCLLSQWEEAESEGEDVEKALRPLQATALTRPPRHPHAVDTGQEDLLRCRDTGHLLCSTTHVLW